MRSSQIQSILKRHRDIQPIFKGVFASNRLPRRIPKNVTLAYIANTDPAHKPGQHWVAIFYTKTCVYYFDSYGRGPTTPNFKRMMYFRKYRKVFGRRIQGDGKECGYYCLYFILAMVYNKDFSCFGDDFNANDRLVRKLVKKYFSRF